MPVSGGRRCSPQRSLHHASDLTGDHKPHNSLYIINATGSIVDRYDKRFCAGDPEESAGGLVHYTPGDHLSVFTINGIRCGALICHDYRYPELYREYKRRALARWPVCSTAEPSCTTRAPSSARSSDRLTAR